MSIFKDTFREYVRDQLSLREFIIDIGNPGYSNISKSGNTYTTTYFNQDDRNKKYTRTLQTGKETTIPEGAFFGYSLNKQCVLRMTSLTDYVEDANVEIGGLEGDIAFQRLRGASLSQNFILEGGVKNSYTRNIDLDQDGVNESVTRRVTTPRAGFPNKQLPKTGISYGDFAIGANAINYGDWSGIVPMPGIIDANIRTKSAYGSLREAKVNFVVHNRIQLSILEMLYMRPGYSVVLEWGWVPYFRIDENNVTQKMNNFVSLEDITQGKIYTPDITQEDLYNGINTLKKGSQGNYDALLGFVKNFGYQARPDGGYDCFTELISMGEIIESLKISPNIRFNKPIEGDSPDYSLPSNFLDDDYQLKQTDINRTEYTKALENNILTEYTGIYGFALALHNFASYSPTVVTEVEITDEEAEQNIPNFEDAVDSQSTTDLANDAGYRFDTNTNYLKDLIKYQAATIGETLKKKLKLNTTPELKNFIIPKAGKINPEAFATQYGCDQPYIRWDALCILINDGLIPKDETNVTPVNVVADRIYDTGDENQRYRLDPLQMAKSYDILGGKPFGKFLEMDFSCDPNVCILPLQFKMGDRSGRGFGNYMENALGYKPKFSIFPTDYILGSYLKDDIVYYRDQPIEYWKRDTGLTSLLEPDQWHRIGSVFLNLNMILRIAETNKDNKKYTVGNFIKDIWDEVNSACPNHNFVLTDDKESKNCFIIDLPNNEEEVPDINDLHEFLPMSNQNIFREFDYQTNIPSALSATVAIQAQDPRNVEDIEGVTFAAFNRAIKNRLFSKDTKSNFDKTLEDLEDEFSKNYKEASRLKGYLVAYTEKFFHYLRIIGSGGNVSFFGSIKGYLTRYQALSAYFIKSQNARSETGGASVIPLNFNATLDGISGVVIGNVFRIDSTRLPLAYNNTGTAFIVFNEEQQITAGQDWTTKIGGKLILTTSKIRELTREELKEALAQENAKANETESPQLPEPEQEENPNAPTFIERYRDYNIYSLTFEGATGTTVEYYTDTPIIDEDGNVILSDIESRITLEEVKEEIDYWLDVENQ